MGGARETALASSTYAPFTRWLLTITGWNWKCHVIIVIKTDLSGYVVPVHSGLCEQYTSNPSGYALGIWLPVSHAPSCIGTTNPSRTGLNPLNISSISIRIRTEISSYIDVKQYNVIIYTYHSFNGSSWDPVVECSCSPMIRQQPLAHQKYWGPRSTLQNIAKLVRLSGTMDNIVRRSYMLEWCTIVEGNASLIHVCNTHARCWYLFLK